jgi:N-methylhydantoinase B
MMPYGIDHDLETSFAGVGVESPNGFGLAGGLPGATVRYVRFRSTGVADAVRAGGSLPSSFSELAETSGDSVYDINVSHTVFPLGGVDYHNWQGGGGYGDPLDREPMRVADDVRAQVVSEDAAQMLYGVVINGGELDAEATRSERERRRLHRLEVARPARTVLSDVADIPDPSKASGTIDGKELRYGDLVEWDLASGLARCVRCKRDLGPGSEDFRLGCLVEESATGEAGPVRGQDYDTGQLVLRRFYCPSCGRQLEAEIAMRSGPRAGFRLAMPG